MQQSLPESREYGVRRKRVFQKRKKEGEQVMIEKIYLRMGRVGITNIISGFIMIIAGVCCVIGGNFLLAGKNKLIF